MCVCSKRTIFPASLNVTRFSAVMSRRRRFFATSTKWETSRKVKTRGPSRLSGSARGHIARFGRSYDRGNARRGFGDVERRRSRDSARAELRPGRATRRRRAVRQNEQERDERRGACREGCRKHGEFARLIGGFGDLERFTP